jgi:PhnB protein
MANKPNYIPQGYRAITPYLVVRGGAKAIDYYNTVFGAKELMRMEDKDGRVGHAELQIGDSHIMLADEYPEMDIRGPESLGGSGVGILVYVPDVDRVFQRAVDEGAKVDREVKDQFYGDRSGNIIDPFGHKWTIATHVEDVSPEEMKRRAGAAMQTT